MTIWGGTAAGIWAGLFALRDYDLSVDHLLSVHGLLETGNAIAVARFSVQDGSQTIAGLLALTYAAAIVRPGRRDA